MKEDEINLVYDGINYLERKRVLAMNRYSKNKSVGSLKNYSDRVELQF